jgi:hypothetical protein
VASPPAQAAGALYSCQGAVFQFPLIDGWVGWLYSDERSIGTDPSHWHTGIDIYPPIQGDTVDVYPLASGYLHQVNWVPNSTKIYYPDQRVTSYMGHIVLNEGLDDGDPVSPDKPIGKLEDLGGNTHLHLSMKYTNSFAHYNDQALFNETHQTEADDPSDAFNAYLKDPTGATNRRYSTYPYYRRPYQDFCRGVGSLQVEVGIYDVTDKPPTWPGLPPPFDPKHPERDLEVLILSSSNGVLMHSKFPTVHYDSNQNAFTGSVVDLGPGTYTVKLKLRNTLRKQVFGSVTIRPGATTTLPRTVLKPGDISGDNTLNILDYNLLISCYSDLLPVGPDCPAATMPLADLSDDNKVNQFDYNIIRRAFLFPAGE